MLDEILTKSSSLQRVSKRSSGIFTSKLEGSNPFNLWLKLIRGLLLAPGRERQFSYGSTKWELGYTQINDYLWLDGKISNSVKLNNSKSISLGKSGLLFLEKHPNPRKKVYLNSFCGVNLTQYPFRYEVRDFFHLILTTSCL